MNKVFIMGRLTKDPELKKTPSGVSVVSFTVAVDRKYKDDAGIHPTDFINCVAFSYTADFLNKFFVKGQLIVVIGSLQTRTWEDSDGNKKYVTEVIVSEVQFTGDNRSQER